MRGRRTICIRKPGKWLLVMYVSIWRKNPLAGPGGAPGGGQLPATVFPSTLKSERAISENHDFTVQRHGHGGGCDFCWCFHGGFKRPETQPQAAKSTILKNLIRGLVGFGAVYRQLFVFLSESATADIACGLI